MWCFLGYVAPVGSFFFLRAKNWVQWVMVVGPDCGLRVGIIVNCRWISAGGGERGGPAPTRAKVTLNWFGVM